MSETKDVLILAIESSCDETAAAVVKNGREVLSNVISSQIALHTLYGGVVPEIASRKHIEKINQVIEEALKEAEVTLDDIDAIGVTYGLQSVDDILNRLRTDYLDILLLHRPDTLMEPEEVADAFRTLKTAGKVRHFGVSNQTPMQIELLNNYLDEPLLINQLQFSIAHCPMINSGINANMYNDSAINRDGGILEYCRLKDITIQAWSPFQYGMFEGVFLGNEKFPELNKVINELAEKYNVTDSAIAVSWILRHPAGIQTIIGTTNKDRIAQISKASHVHLTREEWYRLYMAAGNRLP